MNFKKIFFGTLLIVGGLVFSTIKSNAMMVPLEIVDGGYVYNPKIGDTFYNYETARPSVSLYGEIDL